MALTYTEIEGQKNTRIWIFFAIVVLFYFVIAVILGNVTKPFLVASLTLKDVPPFLTAEEILYVVIFSLAAALIHSAFSMTNVMSFVKNNLGAVEMDSSDTYHQRFRRMVDDVNVATGNKYEITPVVIPTMAMNAFTISDNNKTALIGITEGLLSKLNGEQLQAVVAHEVGHIVSGDTYQTTIGCSLFGVYAAILAGIEKAFEGGKRIRISGRGSSGVVLYLLVIYVLLQIMQFFYNVIRLFVSRDRELRADVIAVRLTRDPISLSEALCIISRGWRGSGTIDRNLESLFIANPVQEAVDESEGFLADLLSTHPPLQRRIRILAQMAHTDVKTIQEGVMVQERARDRLREVVSDEKGPQWMLLEREKGWIGPFDISQLMHLGWIAPDTWLKALTEEDVKQAKDEPLLKPYFDGQLKTLSVSSAMCPRCHQALVEEEYEGAKAQRCVFCHGILLEEDKTRRIIAREEKGFDDRIKKLAELTQKDGLTKSRTKERDKALSDRQCPKCGNRMLRNFYTVAYLVEVDRCLACGLVWFEKDELELVQYLIESAAAL